jgi:60 kDa SS-A/Ro ribonucleoprotein
MSKFNEPRTVNQTVRNNPTATTNAECGLAFKQTPKMELYTRVASALVGEPKFYESGKKSDEGLLKAVQTVLKDDPEFVLKLAVFTREQLYLRSVTTMLLAEYANNAAGSVPNARKYIARAIKRPDDMTELISYQLNRNNVTGRKTKLPMAIKNGVASAFSTFDGYRIAKYNRDGPVKMKDVLFMTHPKPRDDVQARMWSQLIDGSLASPDTWEVMRSTGKMTWSQVIRDVFNKGGKTNNLFAIVRNLRNIVIDRSVTQQDIDLVASMLTDRDAIKHSMILPFRYLPAYVELRKLSSYGNTDFSNIYESLEKAVQISIDNIPKLPGMSVIAIDTSGSMGSAISEKSSVSSGNIAIMLGMMTRRICENSKTVTFDTRQTWQNLPDKDILRNAFDARLPGGATYGYLVLNDMITGNIKSDRLIVLTDMVLYEDGWNRDNSFAGSWIKYNRMYPNSKLYNIDLRGYGLSTVPESLPSARNIAGWSDNVLRMIIELEKGSNAIEEISKISL